MRLLFYKEKEPLTYSPGDEMWLSLASKSE